MKIHWKRVLLAAFLIEVVLAVVLILGFAAAGARIENNVSRVASTVIGLSCFAVAFLVVLWLVRGIGSRFVLHGFLIGLVATVLYLGLVAVGGQMSAALAAYGPATFAIVNSARILGAILGGVVCERRRLARV